MRRPVAAFVIAAALALPSRAAAERPPTGSGIAGGALLGAELTLLVETAFDVDPLWAYVLGGVLGASAGAYAGYLAEDGADPDVSLYAYAAGIALVVPTLVWMGRALEPESPPVPLRAGEPDQARSTLPARSAQALPLPPREPDALRYAPPALVQLGAGVRTLPSFELRPVFSRGERQRYGFEQRHALYVPLLSSAF